jgi:hypothetical protein
MFVRSNTTVARFVFVILALILFVLFCTLGISLVAYIVNNDKQSPYLLSGYLDGSNSVIISQDPKDKTSIPILRSNDRSKGIEFTWCSWLLFEANVNSTTNIKYQNIFNTPRPFFFLAHQCFLFSIHAKGMSLHDLFSCVGT